MTELPKRPGREYEYDLMRAVAALAVVMIHTCAQRWQAIDVQSADWLCGMFRANSAFRSFL